MASVIALSRCHQRFFYPICFSSLLPQHEWQTAIETTTSTELFSVPRTQTPSSALNPSSKPPLSALTGLDWSGRTVVPPPGLGLGFFYLWLSVAERTTINRCLPGSKGLFDAWTALDFLAALVVTDRDFPRKVGLGLSCRFGKVRRHFSQPFTSS